LLILLALKERRVEVEVGYDLEQWITDGFAGETSREVMAPFFRNGQFGPGLRAGAERNHRPHRPGTGRHARRRAGAATDISPTRQLDSGWLPIAIFIVILIVSRLGGWRRPPQRVLGPQRRLVERRRTLRRRVWRRLRWAGFGGGGGGGGFGGGFGGFGGGSSGGGGGGSNW
jgi:uncharacterized protein